MITRIELDGFKTFQDFKLELAPFQVIVGPNGAGKSNLFDALRLLSRLADVDLRSAFQALRGEAGELFTILPDGRPVEKMRLAVEMFVDRQVSDSWGAQAELKYTRLRYELEIARRTDEQGLERLCVTDERLIPIRREDDSWFRHHVSTAREVWWPSLKRGRQGPFISTEELETAIKPEKGTSISSEPEKTTKPEKGTLTISIHQDGHGGRKASVAEKVERTVLSGVTNTEFPHAFAVREEMRTWGFLQLNPEVLRQPSSLMAQPLSPPMAAICPMRWPVCSRRT